MFADFLGWIHMAAEMEVPYIVSISRLSVKMLFRILHSKEIMGNLFPEPLCYWYGRDNVILITIIIININVFV